MRFLKNTANNLAWGFVMNTVFHPFLPIWLLRRNLEWLARANPFRYVPDSPFVESRTDWIGSMAVASMAATMEPPRIILYLHGGGFFMGSIRAYHQWGLRLAFRGDARVYMPEYRLAPKNPYPAALEDAKRAYHWLRAKYPDAPLYLGGDSAGAGLALATALSLRDDGAALPRGVFLLSPLADLTGSGRTMRTNRFKDLFIKRWKLRWWMPRYYGENDPKHPYISPVFGKYDGLPPIQVLVGEPEALFDDAVRIVENARAAKVKVELQVMPQMQHVWPITMPWLSESREAMVAIASFLAHKT